MQNIYELANGNQKVKRFRNSAGYKDCTMHYKKFTPFAKTYGNWKCKNNIIFHQTFHSRKKKGCLANSIHLSLPNFFHTNGMRVSQSSE
jgi:hypothetical protein